ncbi:MAG: hypothetical protein M3167_06045 [Acidobacteriota bacterium]|nr:hypothetical protein [Acidobacteriota bacterium]
MNPEPCLCEPGRECDFCRALRALTPAEIRALELEAKKIARELYWRMRSVAVTIEAEGPHA